MRRTDPRETARARRSGITNDAQILNEHVDGIDEYNRS
jgi:hypothetical protein